MEHFYIFPNSWDDDPIWLSYFSGWNHQLDIYPHYCLGYITIIFPLLFGLIPYQTPVLYSEVYHNYIVSCITTLFRYCWVKSIFKSWFTITKMLKTCHPCPLLTIVSPWMVTVVTMISPVYPMKNSMHHFCRWSHHAITMKSSMKSHKTTQFCWWSPTKSPLNHHCFLVKSPLTMWFLDQVMPQILAQRHGYVLPKEERSAGSLHPNWVEEMVPSGD